MKKKNRCSGTIEKLFHEKLKSEKGFTLLEMVLAAVLVTIFFSMVAALTPLWYKMYTKTIELNHARQIADSVMGTIEDKLRFANGVKIDDTEPDAAAVKRITGKSNGSKFFIPMKNTTNKIDGLVYDDAYFMNHDISLDFSPDNDASPTSCVVTITITKDTGEGKQTVLTKTRTVGLYGEN